jgi:hypothetical protein
LDQCFCRLVWNKLGSTNCCFMNTCP